ncbi:hypothetical protein EM595_1774 [Duffyella gerundensis]|uniref:Uncharacterized protein n=1 Tax=Duffyella gerundensis TaxID=1619313 RepID=A0A0U5L3T3_9GAMM|nr:hypothetical protein EM595_1774 [Duffyella gerundensis]
MKWEVSKLPPFSFLEKLAAAVNEMPCHIDRVKQQR